VVLYLTKDVEQGGFASRMAPFLVRIVRKELVFWKNANDRQDDTDHETMNGDKYPLSKPIRCLPGPKVQVITIDQIWDCCGNSAAGKRLENVCLSLALCRSLIRRFRGLSSAKASLPTAHDSVFNGLLQNEEHYERVFRIIDVEMGFCYDYYFTKYHSIYFGMGMQFPLFLLRVIFLTLVLVLQASDYFDTRPYHTSTNYKS
jgi:hypothetical protein